jgi:putative transposase
MRAPHYRLAFAQAPIPFSRSIKSRKSEATAPKAPAPAALFFFPLQLAVFCLPIAFLQTAAVAANVLDRSFDAPAPSREWIADFTYVWTAEGWLYVAAVVDLFSRRVVGWSMSTAMTAQFVTDALVMAIWRRGKPDALLHHSDRGSQYTSEQFQKLMADHGVVCSMSRSGNVWDNAAMESFFSSLKTERTARKTYRTRDEAKADVFDYIECFYNPKRRHSTIGYLSPVEFEMQAGLA